jgi:hypothetical protein
MKEKITIDNASGGEVKAQFERALKQVAANIEKHGVEADHEIVQKTVLNYNSDYQYWETEVQTVVKCATKEKEISARTPIKIEKGNVYDGSSQQKLPLGVE